MIDTGSDLTTLQPKDSLLMLDITQIQALGKPRTAQGLGGSFKSYTEEAAVGFYCEGNRICWIPTTIDITNPYSGSTLPSTLGNDIIQFGSVGINADRGIVSIILNLEQPVITSY